MIRGRLKGVRLPRFTLEHLPVVEHRKFQPVRAMAHHKKTTSRMIISKSAPPPIYIFDSFWLPRALKSYNEQCNLSICSVTRSVRWHTSRWSESLGDVFQTSAEARADVGRDKARDETAAPGPALPRETLVISRLRAPRRDGRAAVAGCRTRQSESWRRARPLRATLCGPH